MTDEHSRPLNEADVDRDPFAQYGRWFAEAQGSSRFPEAVAVATASASGRPSVRMVLLKGFDHRGFVFFTNYTSDKGRQFEANPQAALLSHWEQLGRQVRVEGPVIRVEPAESDEYFASRPRGSQLGAHASAQSQPVADRAALEAAVAEVTATYEGAEVPRPPSWGGYRLVPERFEFWQNREDRLHDRLVYERSGNAWTLTRIQP
jgi:pyridoxamine 5'-phosphate oxidase